MKVNLLSGGITGRSVNAISQDRYNVYVEVNTANDKTNLTIYGTPGTESINYVPTGTILGQYFWQKYNAHVFVTSTKVELVSITGNLIQSISITTTGADYAICADNGTELCVALHTSGLVVVPAYIINGATYVATALSFGLQSVCFLDSYFIGNDQAAANLGQFRISGQYDGLTWDALDFATAESSPDSLVRTLSTRSTLILFGDWTIEHWYNSGDNAFPFARMAGMTRDIGLSAIASLAKIEDMVLFLAKSTIGNVFVATLQNGTVTHVSSSELDFVINTYPNLDKATGFAYTIGGHSFYQINFDSVSWVYDINSQVWHKSISPGLTKSQFISCSSSNISTLVSSSSKAYAYSLNSGNEGITPIERGFTTSHLSDTDSLGNSIISQMILDMESGEGATVNLSISRDGGHTYGNEITRLTRIAPNYAHKLCWRRLGYARDWVFKYRITGAIKLAVLGIFIESKMNYN